MTVLTFPTGTPVVYCGSIAKCRGPAIVLGVCACEGEGCRGLDRLALVTAGGEVLHHVRRGSVGELRWNPVCEPVPCASWQVPVAC